MVRALRECSVDLIDGRNKRYVPTVQIHKDSFDSHSHNDNLFVVHNSTISTYTIGNGSRS